MERVRKQTKGLERMTRQLGAIILKELEVLWLDRGAVALLFAMPMFFILVMSFALEGVFEAGSRRHPIEILVINPSGGPVAEQAIADLKQLEGLRLIEAVEGTPLTLEKAEEFIRKRDYPLALFFQDGFSEKVGQPLTASAKELPTVSLIGDPAMNEQLLGALRGTIQSVIERRVQSIKISLHFKQVLRQFGDQMPPGSSPVAQNMERQLDHLLADSNRGREEGGVAFVATPPKAYAVGKKPTSTEQNVPGYTIFGVFFIVLTLASSFSREKQDGTFQRILAAPLSKTTLLIGKLLPYYLVNLIQIGLMFAVGRVMFDIRLGNLPALVILSFALAAAANGLGLMVAAIGKTEAQIHGLSILLAIILSALGGMMVPAFVMPNWMSSLSLVTPHAWALSGYHDVMIRGLGLGQVLPEVTVLVCFASFFFLIALWRFRFLWDV